MNEVNVTTLISIADAQQIMGLGRTTIYGLLSDGSLKSVKIGRRNLIIKDSIDALVSKLSFVQKDA